MPGLAGGLPSPRLRFGACKPSGSAQETARISIKCVKLQKQSGQPVLSAFSRQVI
jgi:hypothetical protein